MTSICIMKCSCGFTSISLTDAWNHLMINFVRKGLLKEAIIEKDIKHIISIETEE